ncbi:MAG: hypothetical protein ABSF29_04620 [Tepidisphaeraceae bacterium]
MTTGILALVQQSALAQATQPDDSSIRLYLQAAKILADDDAAKNIMSPAASPMLFRNYPPMSDEWLRIEKQDYDAHAQVRRLIHQAGLLNSGSLPPFDPQKNAMGSLVHLNEWRNMANEIADAALYQSLILHDQPAAFASADDVLHLSELLERPPGDDLVRMLVAIGIDHLDFQRLMTIISSATITDDPGNSHDLPLTTATDWISRLLNHPDVPAELGRALQGERPGIIFNPIIWPTLTRIRENIRRVQTERDFAAMSLAAHVYQYKHGRWPQNLDELKTQLPRLPLDPWGDGRQTLGYALIKSALPDGSDRPLVYSRCRLQSILFFQTDRPNYGFADSPGGQFRDIASWHPPENQNPQPTTQPLPLP